MTIPSEIVDRFITAFYRGDQEAARQYLADDFSFSGPGGARYATAQAYLKASAHVAHSVKSIEKHRVFVDGNDVCIFYDLVLDHRVPRVTVAEWHHLNGDKISSIRTVVDTAPFQSRASVRPEETAVDPVCQMTVEMVSAADTRTHEGVAYYFCSSGCAVSFERDPASYLA